MLESASTCVILMCYKQQQRTPRRWGRQTPRRVGVIFKTWSGYR